jgi:epoxyqueuosine reductase
MELSKLLIHQAHEEGFPLAGVIDIDLALNHPHSFFTHHINRYDEWIRKGYAASMEYLIRGRNRRADPRLLFAEAQSMLCVAVPYPRRPGGAAEETQGPRYARYLQGPDYHQQLQEKLEQVMQKVSQKLGTSSDLPPLRWKICVDTSAVLERTWAALAGLGWIGKNSLLIHPQHGSYLFLAEVLLNQQTGIGPKPLPNYCGNCSRCMQACPTQALIDPGVLNSNRCISFWTLEKRGELALPEEDLRRINRWIAGCDICQEVCPFNGKPTRKELLENPDLPLYATELQDWVGLLKESPEDYKIRVKHSALSRVKPAQFSRNLAIVLTHAISAHHDLLLAQLKSDDTTPSPPIPHLEWIRALEPLIKNKLMNETDESTQKEWRRCLDQITLIEVTEQSRSDSIRNPFT